MQQGSRKVQVFVWGILGLVLILVVALFVRSSLRRSNLPEYGLVQNFTLTNQLGRTVTMADLIGKVWVADVIFTRCAGPCPRMTEQMSKLQNVSSSPELNFVTLTTDPEYDTPAVLKAYAGKFSADHERWHFLTGPKSEILQKLAIDSLKLTVVEKEENTRENPNDLFIHSTIFVLVDKRGRVRGYYESLEPGFSEKISADILDLLGEPE